uniref:RRM domain-containing protein n=1 Tax=Vitis vinifera TaxID=29760 RepID=A5BZG2_VITVI|nr:hypothetical protein VITISV_042642 [Vitis vinifera]
MASQPMLGPRTQSFEAEKSAATLLIRHLPEAIPQDTLSRLFSSYGASSVRPSTSGSNKSTSEAYASSTNALKGHWKCTIDTLRLQGVHLLGV